MKAAFLMASVCLLALHIGLEAYGHLVFAGWALLAGVVVLGAAMRMEDEG